MLERQHAETTMRSKKSPMEITVKRPTYLDFNTQARQHLESILTSCAVRGEIIESDVLQKRVSQLVNFDFSYIEFQLTLFSLESFRWVQHKCPITSLITTDDGYRNRCFLEKAHRGGFIPIVPDMKDKVAVASAFHHLRTQIWDEFKMLAD